MCPLGYARNHPFLIRNDKLVSFRTFCPFQSIACSGYLLSRSWYRSPKHKGNGTRYKYVEFFQALSRSRVGIDQIISPMFLLHHLCLASFVKTISNHPQQQICYTKAESSLPSFSYSTYPLAPP